jgi:hypothetical protein
MGYSQSLETRQKRSLALKGRNPYPRNEVTRARQQDAQKGIRKPGVSAANARRKGMRYRKHIPSCHPKRPLYGNGLCAACYHAKYYVKNENAVG